MKLGGLGGQSGTSPDGGVADASTEQQTCAKLDCGLHGDCVVNPETNLGACVCDEGYKTEPGVGQCLEDTTCIKLRAIECDARKPCGTVGITVSASYCSGRPYTGVTPADLHIEEKGAEDFEEVLPSKTYATVVDRPFVSHVYFLVDVSKSLHDSKVLPQVADGIGRVLDQMEAKVTAADAKPRVAVFAFDGKPYLYEVVPETIDYAAAKAAVAQLDGFTGRDPVSTNLYGALIKGIHALDRAIELRRIVNDDGVLSAGTLVVISDGDDEAGIASFKDAQDLEAARPHKLITVGVAAAQTNYPKLTALGRDGSYSAPTKTLLSQAFDDIGGSINGFTDSLRFIGYCSPARGGTFTARISVKQSNSIECSFDASAFSGGCSDVLFEPALQCAGQECGDLIGCGECPSGKCCVSGKCVGPAEHTKDGTCNRESICEDAMTCDLATSICVMPEAPAASCGDFANAKHLCNSDHEHCAAAMPSSPQTLTCLPDLPTPARWEVPSNICTDSAECASGNCGFSPDEPDHRHKYCLPMGRLYEPCSGAANTAVGCEPGSYCKDGICVPQVFRGLPCETDAQCVSGKCEMGAVAKFCATETECFVPLQL